MTDGERRKLTAIMFTNMVGFSALTQRSKGDADLDLLRSDPRFAALLKTVGRE